MSVQENKVKIQRFFKEVMNEGSLHLIDEIYAPDFINHRPHRGFQAGVEGLKLRITLLRKSFSNLRYDLEDLIAEGDKVVSRWKAHGTHTGEFMGIQPTGREVTFTGIDIVRITNGKVVEGWRESDQLGLLQMLGTDSK
jgi:predicted ester cyclase